ncbi:MAG TPA: hypothetical protein VMW13_04755, partial [Dehalococcoidales bacterium]|nr:hypothetical protein [Dehalococcoidales bacterium]
HECTAPKICGRYFILHCIDGEGTVTWEGGKIRLERGKTVAVPASIEPYGITTDMGCIFYRDYVPDLRKLRKELSDYGISDEKMAGLIISVD